LLHKFENKPEVNNSRQVFQRIDVKTVSHCIQGLLLILVYMLHIEAQQDQVSMCDPPLDCKIWRPAADTGIAGVG
jgi:hypothetical protein